MKRIVYSEIARAIEARANCIAKGNDEWKLNHEYYADAITKEFMPSGSGIDSGVKIDWQETTSKKLVFTFGFHHMNDGGYYDGWTEHSLIVQASLAHGLSLRITGKDRNQIKEYLYDLFSSALEQEFDTEQAKRLMAA